MEEKATINFRPNSTHLKEARNPHRKARTIRTGAAEVSKNDHRLFGWKTNTETIQLWWEAMETSARIDEDRKRPKDRRFLASARRQRLFATNTLVFRERGDKSE
jgi:hypothetical protein